MSVQVLPPLPPPSDLQPSGTRARARFDELVSLGKQAVLSERIWAQIGRLATEMEKDRDFAALGFESMGACIMEIEVLSGYDRSSIYAYKTLWEKVAPNAGESALQMRLGSAQIYWQLPTATQRKPEVKAAAQSKPKIFREKLERDFPEAIIEARFRLSLNLDKSLYEKWRAFLEKCRATEGPNFSYEQALEVLLANADQI